MKNKLFFVFLLTVLSLTLFSASYAEPPNIFEMTEAYAFMEKTDNWSI